jgi:hypothetical protein
LIKDFGTAISIPSCFFSRFISVTDCYRINYDFLIDEIERELGQFFSVQLCVWLGFALFCPLFLSERINSFSFSLSAWFTYLHICHAFSLSSSANLRRPFYLVFFFTFCMICTFLLSLFDLLIDGIETGTSIPSLSEFLYESYIFNYFGLSFDRWHWDAYMNSLSS